MFICPFPRSLSVNYMVSTESPQMGLCSCRACALVGEADDKQVKANVYLQILVRRRQTLVLRRPIARGRGRQIAAQHHQWKWVLKLRPKEGTILATQRIGRRAFQAVGRMYKGPEAERLFLLKE